MRQTEPPYNSGLLRRSHYRATLPPAGVQVREVFAAPGTRSAGDNSTGPSCRRSGVVALATSGRMRRQQEHDARPLPAAQTPRRGTLRASSHARLIRARRVGGVDRRWKARRRGFERDVGAGQTHCDANVGGRERRCTVAASQFSTGPEPSGSLRLLRCQAFWSQRHRQAKPLDIIVLLIEALKGIGATDNKLIQAHTKADHHNPSSPDAA
jgi:hypothetical protein